MKINLLVFFPEPTKKQQFCLPFLTNYRSHPSVQWCIWRWFPGRGTVWTHVLWEWDWSSGMLLLRHWILSRPQCCSHLPRLDSSYYCKLSTLKADINIYAKDCCHNLQSVFVQKMHVIIMPLFSQQIQPPSQLTAVTGTWDWREVPPVTRDDWRCASTGPGAVSVTAGPLSPPLRLRWPADNSDYSRLKVREVHYKQRKLSQWP